ncbi:MAG: DNA adenine methylase [Bacteroidetes bacterium]|nr:MAG: DNA adenine methylase [Bacteroidota bacterium]
MKGQLTTPITYYGGKQKMLKHILPLIPQHSLYCEPFLGGGAVFWAKKPSPVEVINDLDGRITNFYKVCQSDFGALRTLILATPHSRQMHREAERALKYPDLYSDLKRAWAFYVQTQQGFGGQLFGGWGYERKTNKSSLKIYNKRSRFIKQFQQRLNLVQIECNDALQVIKSRDTEQSFFYVDPPYFNSDCAHYSGYTIDDYKALLDVLAGLKGKFLLSSYPSDILMEYAKNNGWYMKRFESRVAVTHLTVKMKTEVLVANYPI